MNIGLLLVSVWIIALVHTIPPEFPSSGNGLWYSSPGDVWAKSWLPIGNGYLAAMLPGGIWQESTQLNIESLWTGGPFADPSYNGGNKLVNESDAMAEAMQQLRQEIFADSSGRIDSIDVLTTPQGAYGSYTGAGYFLSTMNSSDNVTNYSRWLNLDDRISYTTWVKDNAAYSRETFCSNPTRSCIQYLSAVQSTQTGDNSAVILPRVTFVWAAPDPASLSADVTCLDDSTISVRGYLSIPGILYELIARVQAKGPSAQVNCGSVTIMNTTNSTLIVSGASDVWLTWVGETEYNITAGDAAHNYSFKEDDPHQGLLRLINAASPSLTEALPFDQIYTIARAEHVADVQSILGAFSLTLPFPKNSWENSTDELVAAYTVDQGNPYIEWLTFNYGRYILASSTRSALPANLQGKWASGLYQAWSADYHANINVQMCYWAAEVTNMGPSVMQGLWDYMEYTWAPRGEYTAEVLYNISRG